MKVLVVLWLAVAFATSEPASVSPLVYSGYPAGVLTYAGVDPIGSQYHAQDVFGQASYGHVSGLQSHHAVQDAAGNKVGSYSHIAPNGQLISTNYVADAAGYRVVSNGLPVGIQETPEVVAARKAHLAEVEAAKSRSRRAVSDTPASTSRLAVPVISAPFVPHPVVSYPVPFFPHVIAKREANPQTPASTVKVVPHIPLGTPHIVASPVVTHPVVGYNYPHFIAKREANPQTPASTVKVVPQFPFVAPHVVASPVVSHPVVAYNYPHIIAKREANPQTPASTVKVVPHIPLVAPHVVASPVVTHPVVAYNYPHIIAKREANPQTPASTTKVVPVVSPRVVVPHPFAYRYPYHVIAKRAAQVDTPASTARLPASRIVSPVVVPSVYPVRPVHPVFGLYSPTVIA